LSKNADWRTVGLVREAAWLAWGVESGKRELEARQRATWTSHVKVDASV